MRTFKPAPAPPLVRQAHQRFKIARSQVGGPRGRLEVLASIGPPGTPRAQGGSGAAARIAAEKVRQPSKSRHDEADPRLAARPAAEPCRSSPRRENPAVGLSAWFLLHGSVGERPCVLVSFKLTSGTAALIERIDHDIPLHSKCSHRDSRVLAQCSSVPFTSLTTQV